MGTERDQRDQIQRAGLTGVASTTRSTLPIQAQHTVQVRNQGYVSEPIGVVDPAVDHEWAFGYKDSNAPHTYFDYYFTGQDIRCYIDGAFEGGHQAMPVLQLAFNMQQQKTPVYGFWDYTYAAVMKGTRMVNGVLQIATKSTHYMTDRIAQAAISRDVNGTESPIRGLDSDETLMQEYWGKNIDPSVAYNNNRHIWSVHPPFNLIVVYGIQSTSVHDDAMSRRDEVLEEYKHGDNPLMTDVNERLVESDPVNNSMRRIIENIELTGLQVEYGPDGQVCSETYSFFARDIFLPR